MTTRGIMSGVLLAAMATVSLAACTYSRTYEEQPVATTPAATVVVPQQQPNTVIVPQQQPSTVVVPQQQPSTVILPQQQPLPPNTVIVTPPAQ